MIKILNVSLGIVGFAFLGAGALGVVRAATLTPPKQAMAINKYVYAQEKLDAVAQVLNTTTYKVDKAYKDHGFNNMVAAEHISLSELATKVTAQLKKDLMAKGFTLVQVENAIKVRGLNGSL